MSNTSLKIRFPLSTNDSDYFNIIKDLALKNVLDHCTLKDDSLVYERMNQELKIVQKYGYAKNFYLAYLIAEFAKKQGLFYILLGNTSASLLSYLLGISLVNPLAPYHQFIKNEEKEKTMPLEVCFYYDGTRVPIFHFLGSKEFYQAMLECEKVLKEKLQVDSDIRVSNCIIVTKNAALTSFQKECKKKKINPFFLPELPNIEELIKEIITKDKILKFVQQCTQVPLSFVSSYLKENKEIHTFQDFIQGLGILFQIEKANISELKNIKINHIFAYREEVFFFLPPFIERKIRLQCMESSWRGRNINVQLEEKLKNQGLKEKDFYTLKSQLQYVLFLPTLGMLVQIAYLLLHYTHLIDKNKF